MGVSFIQSTVCITNDWWCVMSYEETESPYDGRIRVYITRTYSVEIDRYTDDDTLIETFRCRLAPLFNFYETKIKECGLGTYITNPR